MNKRDLIDILKQKSNYLDSSDIQDSIEIIIDQISQSLSSGNRIEIRGFGSFSTRRRDKRVARNPKTGKSIIIEKKFHPYFRASKHLKEILNS